MTVDAIVGIIGNSAGAHRSEHFSLLISGMLLIDLSQSEMEKNRNCGDIVERGELNDQKVRLDWGESVMVFKV